MEAFARRASRPEEQLALWRGHDRWVKRFEMPSLTRYDVVYTVAVDAVGNWGCSCPAWVHDPKRNPCKHIKRFRLAERHL